MLCFRALLTCTFLVALEMPSSWERSTSGDLVNVVGEGSYLSSSDLARAGKQVETKKSAWLIQCLKEDKNNNDSMENCLVAFCSLLQTTDPEEVVVMVDDLAFRDIGDKLRSSGAQLFLAPTVNHHRIQRNWTSFQAPRSRKVNMQLYAAKKFYAWTLTQFSKVLFVDGTDVVFLRNASRMMTEYEPFASIRDSQPEKSGRCSNTTGFSYLNAGILLLRPSVQAFHTLMQTYFRGNFTFCPGSSGVMYGNQDTITNFAFQLLQKDGTRPPSVLGDFHEWPFCFNYRGWPDQSHCAEPLLLHKPSETWPSGLKQKYIRLFRKGQCRVGTKPQRQTGSNIIKCGISDAYNYTLSFLE